MAMSVSATAVVLLTIATQLACLAKVLSRFSTGSRLSACIPRARALFKRGLSREPAETPQGREISREYKKLLAQRRVKCSKVVAFGCWVATCLVNVAMVVDIVAADSSMMVGGKYANVYGRVIVGVVLSVPSLFPKVMELSFVPNLTHVLCMGCVCSMAFAPRHASLEGTYSEMLSASALCLCGCATHVGVITCTNLVFLGCSIVGNSASVEESKVRTQIIHGQIFLFVLRMMMTWCADAALKMVTKMEVEARYEMRQQPAVSALLSMTCDAVVDSDCNFRFEEHFPKFAGMLMHGPGKSLHGQGLLDFVSCAEERSRVEFELRRSAIGDDTQPSPGMTTASLVDAIGNQIKTTLLHVPYSSIDGSLRHLIGVREESDGWGSNKDEVARAAVLRPELRERLSNLGSATLGRLGSGGSSRSRVSHEDAQSARSAEVYFSKSLPLRWMSDTFQSELGIQASIDDGEESRLFLCNRLTDDGAALFKAMTAVIEKQERRKKTGNFVKVLGDFDFLTALDGKGHEVGAGTTRRTVWMNFYVPLRENEHGLRYAAIAISKHGGARRTPSLKGTASSLVAENLSPRSRAGFVNL